MLAVGATTKQETKNQPAQSAIFFYDSQCHLLVCEKLLENTICDNVPKYDDLFSLNLERKIVVVRIQFQNQRESFEAIQQLNWRNDNVQKMMIYLVKI